MRWYDNEFGAGFLNPIQNLINATSEGTTVFNSGVLNYRDDAAFNTVSAGLTSLEQFSALWSGFMNITTAGNYVFTTESDDGSAWWIDLNRNGIFEGPTEFVLNTQNQDQGATTRGVTFNNLQPGNYEIAIGFYENGGGNLMRAAITRPGESLMNLEPTLPAQNNVWSYAQNRSNNANFSTNPVTLNANGTINTDIVSTSQATIGPLTMAPGTTLTTTGGRLTSGPLTTSGGTVTKAGTGTLAIPAGTGVAAGTTINVDQGALEITNSPTGVTSIDAAPLQLSGGTLAVNSVGVESGAVQPGWLGKFYNLPLRGSDAVFGNLDNLTPVASTVVAAVNFDDGQGNLNPFAGIGVTVNLDDHAAQFRGKINITAADNYTFETTSDDGSVLWLDANNDGDFNDAGEEIVNNRGLHGPQIRTGTIALTPGDYRLRVEFFERGGGSQIIARYGQGANPTALIPQSVMSAVPEVAPDYQSNVTVTENSTISREWRRGNPTVRRFECRGRKDLDRHRRRRSV